MSEIKPRRNNFAVPSLIFSQEPEPFADDYARRCFRVLRMTAILHGKGFHGLRVFPYKYPLAYRVELFPAKYAAEDGVRYSFSENVDRERLIARHSGASGDQYFGWEDATKLSAHGLALLFVERFPELARAAYHLDFAYAGWFVTLLAHCEYGYLPFLFGEYEEEIGAMRLHRVEDEGEAAEMQFPLPPSVPSKLTMEPRPTPDWMEK